jgi:hypothetical protein
MHLKTGLSAQAAVRVTQRSSREFDQMTDRDHIRTRILHELVKAGTEGLTDSQLATILSANKNHIPTRRRDVELNGFCKKTELLRQTDTGSQGIVHVATEAGIAFAETGEKVPCRPPPPVQTSRMFKLTGAGHIIELTETVSVSTERGDLSTPVVSRHWRVLDKDGTEVPAERFL